MTRLAACALVVLGAWLAVDSMRASLARAIVSHVRRGIDVEFTPPVCPGVHNWQHEPLGATLGEQ